jgi:hypothetical protein
MPKEYYEEPDRKRTAQRYLNRAWLVLSVCWIAFIIYWMAKEPGLASQIGRRPLRMLGAAVDIMLAPLSSFMPLGRRSGLR